MSTSVNYLAGPPITMSPKWTVRTGRGLGIVYSFFVRATDDAVCSDYGLGTVFEEKRKDFFADGRIAPSILLRREPATQRIGFGALCGNDADCDLARTLIVRSVERHGGDRIPAEAAVRALLEH
jgi:hypothetical protein